jgi:hypothetical protein
VQIVILAILIVSASSPATIFLGSGGTLDASDSYSFRKSQEPITALTLSPVFWRVPAL